MRFDSNPAVLVDEAIPERDDVIAVRLTGRTPGPYTPAVRVIRYAQCGGEVGIVVSLGAY